MERILTIHFQPALIFNDLCFECILVHFEHKLWHELEECTEESQND